MYVLLAFLLGYLTCYLEMRGVNWPGLVGGISAIGIIVLRLLAGDMLHPVTSGFIARMQERFVKPGSYLAHHLGLHKTYTYKQCQRDGLCAILTSEYRSKA